MEISTLAARQKRLRDWTVYLEREVQDPRVRKKMEQSLKSYANVLFRCWEKNQISEGDELLMTDLERELNQLNEEARFRVIPRGQA